MCDPRDAEGHDQRLNMIGDGLFHAACRLIGVGDRTVAEDRPGAPLWSRPGPALTPPECVVPARTPGT